MKDQLYISDVLYVDTESKEKPLTVNTQNTVQPVAFMRLGIFVPKPARSAQHSSVIDASELCSQFEYARSEGFTEISIVGPRLDMDTDFKVWIGIIRAFSKYGIFSNRIKLKFSEFAKDCGFPSKKLDSKLRASIHESLLKIRGKSISFKRGKDTRAGYNTGLIKVGFFDADKDIVELEADERLWELYYYDFRVVLQQHAIKALPRQEVAQAIYTFIASLPPNPAPISFDRLRDRLSLVSEIKEQNRVIKKAIAKLIDIGYLDASIVRKDNKNVLIVHKRTPKLTPVIG
ncbi:protein RepA [Xenorhabdus hominickii]|nr:protein RepA [Xenorhabdus hominickii]ARD69734.1 Replication protein RepA [Xenorhabdus hominickii]